MGTADQSRRGTDARALLEEGRWVRDLARKLVGDFARAEDVAQETCLAALKHGPSDAAALRPWLVRVVTNFAREMRRGEKNRSARERRAARHESLPSTSETAERLELQRALLDALAAIDEPYRTTIRLRYFDGLSAAGIARRTGVPAGTVRWRLMRGLELLRERLDGRFGGERQAWCLAFLPLLHKPPLLETAAANLTTISGVWIMSATLKTALVGALALSAALVVWNMASDHQPIEPHAALPSETPLQPVERKDLHAPKDELAAVAIESRRDEIAPAAQPETKAPAAAVVKSTRIDARFIDTSGRPLPNVAFGMRGVPAEDHVISAADGSATLEVDASGEMWSPEVEAFLAGYATWFHALLLEQGKSINLGEVVLAPGGAVAGIVLGHDGAPVADALILVSRPELESARDIEDSHRIGPETPEDMPSSRSHRDGTFRVDGVAAKVVRVWACATGMRYSVSPSLELLPRQVLSGITLTLEPLADDDTISGIVLAPDGSPVPGTSIEYSYRSEHESGTSSFTAGDDGRFEHKLLRKVSHDFSAKDPKDRWPTTGRVQVPAGTHDLVLQFAEPRSFDLLVSREHGSPVESFSVRVRTGDERRELAKEAAEGHVAGKLRLDAPGEPFTLFVAAKGMSEERVGPLDPEHVPDTVRVELSTLPGVHGKVLRGKTGLSHATVSLYEIARSDARVDHNGFLSRLLPTLVEADVTDDDGRFWLTGRRAGAFAILCEAEGMAMSELSPLEIDAARGLDGLEIVMSSGGSIEGRVLLRGGRDPAGVLVAANRFDAKPRIVRVGADGTFAFEHLTPGAWEITRAEHEISPYSSSTSIHSGDDVKVQYNSNCEVHEGRVTRFNLDLTDIAPVLLAGSVTINGAAALGWTAQLWPSDPKGPRPDRARAAVDSSGRLSVELPEPGAYHVTLHAPAEVVPEVVLETELSLVRGDNPWIVDLEAGSIEGRIAAPSSRTRLNYSWKGTAGLSTTISIPIDGQSFKASLVPAGHGELVSWIDDPNGHSDEATIHVAVDVPRGAVRQVNVP